MPPAQRRQALGVIEALLREPQRFGFFQTVRLLEQWLGDEGGLQRIRFRNSLSLAFPSSEVEALALEVREGSRGQDDADADADTNPGPLLPDRVAAVDVTPAFMGLLGGSGTLPPHYTEAIAQRELHGKDMAARAFLDLFSHRAVTLMYEAWRKHRLALRFESDPRQHFLPMALALAGLGQASLRNRLDTPRSGVADEALAFFAGAVQQRQLSASQLQRVLQGYLKVPVLVEQFVGRWFTLPREGRHHLGIAGGAPLGQAVVLGERVWQRDLRVRLVLGPLDHSHFRRFLPGGAGARALKELLTLMGGVALEFEINLRLQKDDVRGTALDSRRPLTQARLGWDTFVHTKPAEADRTDVRYDIHAEAT